MNELTGLAVQQRPNNAEALAQSILTQLSRNSHELVLSQRAFPRLTNQDCRWLLRNEHTCQAALSPWRAAIANPPSDQDVRRGTFSPNAFFRVNRSTTMTRFERGLHATPDIAASTSGAPVPVPASKSAIFMPADQYLHRGAPTEWWWHVGTLQSDDRIFGFEINTAAYSDRGFAFSQVMLTDVANAKHYQRTTIYT